MRLLEDPTTTITELYITLSPPLLRSSREPVVQDYACPNPQPDAPATLWAA